ncbi:dihydrodipicolinate synthase family protein [Streptomyces sparsogenes]|uniref:Dihydrodipicolinate synthetase n=1 Tax=Streptomyces sparsogenes DSM 40356 TaxID=1331668 RepID=A0A1R1SAY5_9ACTN|nr:dihydrodipicolinate synthase family protein [Streptomyces sparsogenes]OMI35495.1 dihydrodipicolinate synthetase [Streptomyces sparsogenes DSM 40356]
MNASFNTTRLVERLGTVIGIPVVPYDAEGAVDLDLTVSLATRLFRNGVTVLTPNGNTGEFYALSPDERRQVLRCVLMARDAHDGAAPNTTADGTADGAPRATTIVAGVGLDLETAISDARFARDSGADAIMIHQPVLPYLTPDGWVEYHVRIARSVPDIGVLPYLTKRAVTGAHITRLVERTPNVVGLKYSVPDPAVFATTRAEAPDGLLWIAGLAESYAPAYWQAGARAFTSGLVNVAPAVSLAMLTALGDDDYATATRIWRQIRHFEELRARDASANNVSVVKEAMHQIGLCRRDVRPPSHPLSEALAREVAESMAGWNSLIPEAAPIPETTEEPVA